MLFTANKDRLGEKPHLFRYFYFLISSFRVISYGQWKAMGEPNPFVSPQEAKRRHTSQQEIADIFQDRI